MSRAAHAPLFVREMGLSMRFAAYLLAGLLLVMLDARYTALEGLRAFLGGLLHPIRAGLALPADWLGDAGGFFVTHGELKQSHARLTERYNRLRAQVQDHEALARENAQLRALLSLAPSAGATPLPAEILQAAPDPFSRKVILDRGTNQGLQAGWPVIDALGLVGQVTHATPVSAEVTLITAKEQSAPVMNTRNGLRVVVTGLGSDSLMEVRFLDMHADLKAGDLLYTSGLDGVYPPGIPVARVIRTETPRDTPFARAWCAPLGGVGQYRQVLVLKPGGATK
jgi:rod shape-determining protein MreC